MQYGFLSVPGTREWSFTRLPQDIVLSSGDWRLFHPKYEAQADKYETNGCTVWAVQNAIEMMEKYQTGMEPNFSEFFTIILAKIAPPGRASAYADKAIRDHGLIPADMLPLPDTEEAYLTNRTLSRYMLDEGLEWLNKWNFDREELFAGEIPRERQEAWIRYGLKRSPLAVGIDGHRKLITYLDENNRATFFDTYNHTAKEQNLKDVQIAECVRFYLAPRIHSRRSLKDFTAWLRGKISE